MKQHIIIVKVYDHNIIPRTFEKVCRSKSGAIREARDLNCMALIRRYADEYDAELDKFVFVPKSHFERDNRGNLMVFGTNSYCHAAIEVIDMDGNSVNVCSYGGCQDYDKEHLCETPDECNCEKVWAELKARGFEGKFPEVEDTTEQAEEHVEQESAEEEAEASTIKHYKSGSIHHYEYDGIEATIFCKTNCGIYGVPWQIFVYYPHGTIHHECKSFPAADAYVRGLFKEHDDMKEFVKQFCEEHGIAC